MKREATIFEYREIIIPLHEEEIEKDLIRALKYSDGSVERKALILSVRLKEIHVQYLKLHIVELEYSSNKVQDEIRYNKLLEKEVRAELELHNIDVRRL